MYDLRYMLSSDLALLLLPSQHMSSIFSRCFREAGARRG